jgi:hypothetical protein
MKPQRRGRAIAMTAEEIDEFLAGQRTCRVATHSSAGPHLSPVWFVWDGCTVWLHSLVRSQRFADIARDGRVSVLADDGHGYDELRGVELRGVAAVVGDVPRVGGPDDALAEPERLFGTKYGDGSMSYDGRHAWLRVDPVKIVSWDFRKSMPAPDPVAPPAQLACERYVAFVNAGDFDGVAGLFAEDGLLAPPPALSGPVHGRAAIREAYRTAIEPMRPHITSASYVTSGNQCAASYSGTSDTGPAMDVVDIVTVDDAGLITNCTVYAR